jgi:hypothetical protein
VACVRCAHGKVQAAAVSRPSKRNNFFVGSTAETLASMVSILVSRRVVRKLIADKFGANFGVTAVGKLLAKLGLTPQKLLRRAYERDPAAIEAWKSDTYPSLVKWAKKPGAEIYFWHESGFRADVVQGTTWGVRGQTPVLRVPGQRQSVSAASAVNARGGFWFATYKGGMNSGLFIEMLKVLMHRRRKPLMLILDSLPAH